ncbi:Asp-tRNA(Asn)/Glu-tRNA(Gln) amidotransferase subunit GatB [Roseivirga echinicomitans]
MSSIQEKLYQSGYKSVIGLEVHVQLNTESKIFSSDPNDFGAEPNTHVSAVSLAHPGTLPVLNEAVLEKAIKMGLACQSQITDVNHFARKHYFYPDSPKGFQTTQDKTPICVGGKIELFGEQLAKQFVQLHHIHLEDDAGKSIHDEGPDTLIDLNRAGTPLIEIVTDPDMSLSEEAAACLQEIRRLVRYLEISSGNMEDGELRCDANISIMRIDAKELGEKVEVKNMNSISNVKRAIDHELERQLKMALNGEAIAVETRTFDPVSGTTAGMRFKETMNDYRYFPCPDLPPAIVTKEILAEIAGEMPVLPSALRRKFTENYGLTEYDALLLTEEREIAYFFEALCHKMDAYKAAANWINGPIKGLLNEKGIALSETNLSLDRLSGLIRLVESNQVSFSVASQRILPRMLEEDISALELAQSLNLLMVADSDELLKLIKEVLVSLPDKVKAYRSGKKALFGLFMGEVMKKSGSKADPKKLKELLEKELSQV